MAGLMHISDFGSEEKMREKVSLGKMYKLRSLCSSLMNKDDSCTKKTQ